MNSPNQFISTQNVSIQAALRILLSGILIAVGVIVAFALSPHTASAQSLSIPGTITVVGEGKVNIEPDIARINIGVEVFNDSVAAASAENTALIETIIGALKEQGVAEKDIQTSGFNIYAERYGPSGPLSDDEINYRVNNTVLVVIRDLDRVADVLDAAIAAGANNINGVNFQVEDPSSVESDARISAVEDARAKAEELAALTGVSVGKVVSISEVIGGGGGGFYQSNFEQATNDVGGGGGFAPGELGLVMRLQITYEIADMGENAIIKPVPGSGETVTELEGIVTMFIAPEKVECVGVGPQSCLQVKYSEEEEWTLFYTEIEGFEHEPGFGYELLVDISEVENPPADASSLRYTLVEQVAKIDVSDEEAVAPADAVQQADFLAGTTWVVSGIRQDDTISTVEIDQEMTVQFGDGRLSGNAGCNTYSAEYTIRGELLDLGMAIATRMACPDEIMQREQLFLQALETVTRFSFDGEELALSDADGRVQVLLSKSNS